MSLATPYATRLVRYLDLLTLDGWRLKLYGITYRGERRELRVCGLVGE
jgi:hypothetical protein